MPQPPRITFIDRDGKVAVMPQPPIPRSGDPCYSVADRAGKAVALQTSVPSSGDPLTALARGVVAATGGWTPGFRIDLDCWMDDWSCNEYSENFDSPPLAEPPWTGVTVSYGGDKVTLGSARMRVYPAWPMAFGEYFYWPTDIEDDEVSIPQALMEFSIDPPSGSPIIVGVYIEASVPPWNEPPPAVTSFEFYFSTYHPSVGTVTSGLYYYEADPWLLDGQKFSATVHKSGLISVNFYSVNWDNGG